MSQEDQILAVLAEHTEKLETLGKGQATIETALKGYGNGQGKGGVFSDVADVRQRVALLERLTPTLVTRDDCVESRAECPVTREIASFRAEVASRFEELRKASKADRDARTKLLAALLSTLGVIFGGAGLAVIQRIIGG